ncbi:endoglin [Meleagris gallopavo]|uniref:endoglin n=1 Tax=Meleagris gallopavo TaxID=9103 RepID=UPI0012AB8014|nr:endoglin [Meleagris gallopavo]
MCRRSSPLLPLLLALLGRPDPAPAEHCDLQPVTAEPPITLTYTTSTVLRGCVSSSSTHTEHEVHVLSIQWSKTPVPMLNVSIIPRADDCTRQAVLILQCPQCSASITSPCQDLLIRTDACLSPKVQGTELPEAAKGDLLDWVRNTYRGITSYSELKDPQRIHLHLGENSSSPLNCVPQKDFDATPHLEAEVLFREVKGCTSSSVYNARAAHIVHLLHKPSLPITEVNLTLSCLEQKPNNQILVLQGPANITWLLMLNNCSLNFLISGTYRILHIPMGPQKGELLPDTEQGLIAKAFEKNYSIIASYSVIPISPHITLKIHEREVLRKPSKPPTVPTSSAPSPELMSSTLLLMLSPWKCTDDTMEIVIARSHLEPIKDVVNITLRDISCQAEKNATHFMLHTLLSGCGTLVESHGRAKNELILSLSKGSVLRSVRVAFQCSIPRELFLRLFPTADFKAPQTELEVNKEVFVQASMHLEDYLADLQLKECYLMAHGMEPMLLVQGNKAKSSSVAMLEEPPSNWTRKVWRFRFTYTIPEGRHVPFSATLKCKAGLQNNTIFEKVLEVKVKDVWRPPNNQGLGLSAVLGITFGAFLIGALLTAGLWYIYSHTREYLSGGVRGAHTHVPLLGKPSSSPLPTLPHVPGRGAVMLLSPRHPFWPRHLMSVSQLQSPRSPQNPSPSLILSGAGRGCRAVLAGEHEPCARDGSLIRAGKVTSRMSHPLLALPKPVRSP